MSPKRKIKAPPGRSIIEEGRPLTLDDFELPGMAEHLYIHEDWKSKVKYWFAGAEKESFRRGKRFIVRLLAALSTNIPQNEFSTFLPGRLPNGCLTRGTVWPVAVVEWFGSERMVNFIPTLPYMCRKDEYPPYSEPSNNPYLILLRWVEKLRHMNCPKHLKPLLMKNEEIDRFRKHYGLKSRFFSQPILPAPKMRYFAYALIYQGYDLASGEEFVFKTKPYGLLQKHGLQLVGFNDQVYMDIQRHCRMRTAESNQGNGSNFLYPDPTDAKEGVLITIWNRRFPHPFLREDYGRTGSGYAAALSTRFIGPDNNVRETDLSLNETFQNWYYQNWQPERVVLRGITGVEQVHLLAEFFPELKSVCEQAWQTHPLLLEAWEKAFALAPDNYDFIDFLFRKYRFEDFHDPQPRTRKERECKPDRSGEASTVGQTNADVSIPENGKTLKSKPDDRTNNKPSPAEKKKRSYKRKTTAERKLVP